MSKDCSCEGYFRKIIAGETIGTFLMCFFGIGSFATASLFGALDGAFQIGMVWGVTIAIAIYACRNLSSAHFNPAVTFAMCLSGRTPWKDMPIYVIAQMVGAILAGAILWVFFEDSVTPLLTTNAADMSMVSKASAIWCNIFPNTPNGVVSMPVAAFAEGIGTFILIAVIFSLTEGSNLGKPSINIAPLFIGFTVSIIITTVGPMTNAGLNPARDLGPRIVGYIVGWDKIAFSSDAIIVYVIAPLAASICATGLFKIIDPLQKLGYK